MSSKIEKLQEKKRQLEEQLKQLSQQENAKKRKEDNRRKMLYGIALDYCIRNNLITPDAFNNILNSGISSTRDRQFLGLPTVEDSKKAEANSESTNTVVSNVVQSNRFQS